MIKLRNKKGDTSLMGVIIAFIAITMIASFFNITKKNYVKNEIQSILDVSTINALNNSIDRTAIRTEMYKIKGTNEYIDKRGGTVVISHDTTNMENVIKTNLETELSRNIKTTGVIKNYKVENIETSLINSSKGVNYGTSATTKPQIYMDATISFEMDDNKNFDALTTHSYSIKNAFSGNSYNITITGTAKDGKVRLIARTTSRVVFK